MNKEAGIISSRFWSGAPRIKEHVEASMAIFQVFLDLSTAGAKEFQEMEEQDLAAQRTNAAAAVTSSDLVSWKGEVEEE